MTKAVVLSEFQEQQSLRKRLYYSAPQVQLVAVPNAARRTHWEARRVKQEGMATGFPDLICLAPGGLVAFVEMKNAKGRVSDNQSEWIERLTNYGFPAAVCRSADAAVEFLRGLGFPIREHAA